MSVYIFLSPFLYQRLQIHHSRIIITAVAKCNNYAHVMWCVFKGWEDLFARPKVHFWGGGPSSSPTLCMKVLGAGLRHSLPTITLEAKLADNWREEESQRV